VSLLDCLWRVFSQVLWALIASCAASLSIVLITDIITRDWQTADSVDHQNANLYAFMQGEAGTCRRPSHSPARVVCLAGAQWQIYGLICVKASSRFSGDVASILMYVAMQILFGLGTPLSRCNSTSLQLLAFKYQGVCTSPRSLTSAHPRSHSPSRAPSLLSRMCHCKTSFRLDAA
jgi:hypothetical protein